jgi:hypothetical protein
MKISGLLGKRVLKIFVGIEMLWILVLHITHWEIFPCEAFVYDSEEGYYSAMCSFSDEDTGELLFLQSEWHDTRPVLSTWLAALVLLVVTPGILAAWLAAYGKRG